MAENDFSINDAPTMRPVPASGGRHLVAGDTILGRYAVVRELGEGGMGVVYQCLDTVGGVEVAVKGLPPEVSRNEDEMEDIRANYQIVRKLRHPNIAGVATLEKDAAGGDYYLVMDLAAGVTLKRWARRHTDAGLDAKLAILRQVAAALDYAHAEKVIHRDVKPENVMVDDDGRVKVLDFGLAAQIRSSQSRTSNTVTSKGGTPGYKSPEQWLGRPQQAPADVYAFGVMAYWLFSGHLPFDGDDPVVLGHAVLSAPVEPIPDLSAHMNAALVKALAKEPNERFASCGAFMDALEGKAFSRVEHVERVDDAGGSRSRATVKGLIAAALLAALAGSAWWWANGRGGRTETTWSGTPGTNVVVKPLPIKVGPTEADITDIAVEATVQKARIARIDDSDGFKARKNTLADDLVRATANGKVRRSFDAAQGFSNYVNECKELLALDEARQTAKKSKADAQDAKSRASEAEALQYAETRWNEANRFLETADDLFAKMSFADAVSKYAAAAKQFGLCVTDAGTERKRQEDEKVAKVRAEKEAQERAERESKEIFVKTTLQAAQTYFDAEKWRDCIAEADKVLGMDADNEAAVKLKKDAESHLVPTLRVVAKIDGGEVLGARVDAGGKTYATPFVWKLEDGGRYGPYKVSYESGGRLYYGTFNAVTVDWSGPRTITVALREYVRPKDGGCRTFALPGGVRMEMVYVAPGSFQMGSENGKDEEKPVHKVTLTKGYWIGKYPVTQAQWNALVSAMDVAFEKERPTACFSSGGDGSDIVSGMDTSDFPMERISWNDCKTMIDALNGAEREGCRWSLPTEAQWEFAARGGNKSRGYIYSGGNDLDAVGWYYENSGVRKCSYSNRKAGDLKSNRWRPHSVREKDVGNELGIVGMSGNVFEWCNDWHSKAYYTSSPTEDPQGPASGGYGYRVSRGGSWYCAARPCRSAFRQGYPPHVRNYGMGLRLCCSAGPHE